jgi:hypothetical protein
MRTHLDIQQAALTLLNAPALRACLSQAGWSLVEREYDWAEIAQPLLTLIDEMTRGMAESVSGGDTFFPVSTGARISYHTLFPSLTLMRFLTPLHLS